MLKIGFLASRAGTSMRAILSAIDAGVLAAEARLVVSNNSDAAALAHALEAGIPAQCIRTVKDPDGADAALTEALQNAGVELVVLSGYLRRLGPRMLGAYRNRVLNIHPGPLPAFGGEGMYGRRVHEAVVSAGLSQTEICIHLVDEEYDHGPCLARTSVPLREGVTAVEVEELVTSLEPGFFVETLRQIAAGEVVLP